MACGTNHATHAMGRPLVAVEAGYELSKVQQKLARLLHRVKWPVPPAFRLDLSQLQLDKWSASHSLWLNLWQLHEAAKVSQAQIKQMEAAASKLPILQCLHIIGRPKVPFTQSSVEGVLLSLLARHAAVLTLQVMRVQMPLDLPALQHLVLSFNASEAEWEASGRRMLDYDLLPAIGLLKGLKSLYIRSDDRYADGIPIIATDLTGCVHLKHVVVQGIRLGGKLVLPAECAFHAKCEITYNYEVTEYVADQVTELIVRDHPSTSPVMADISRWYSGWLLRHTPPMHNLKQLRLVMSKDCIDKSKEDGVLKVHFKSGHTPNLEVLELDMPCGVDVEMHPIPQLKVLVLISTGVLQLHELICQAPQTLKQVYLQSGKAFPPDYRTELEKWCAQESWAGLRLLEYLNEEQDSWTAQMPKGFQPSNLRDCYCGACPECLVRAGVPILCDQAWTRDGFEKYLRHHCNENA